MNDLLPWAISLLSILVGVILHLQNKNKDLKNKVGAAKADADLRELLVRKENAHEDSQLSEKEYIRIRDKYISEHSGDGAGENEM